MKKCSLGIACTLFCVFLFGCASSASSIAATTVTGSNITDGIGFLKKNPWVIYDSKSLQVYTLDFYKDNVVTLQKRIVNTQTTVDYSGSFEADNNNLSLKLTLNPNQVVDKNITAPNVLNNSLEYTPAGFALLVTIKQGDNIFDKFPTGKELQLVPPISVDFGVYYDGQTTITNGINGEEIIVHSGDKWNEKIITNAVTHFRGLENGEIEEVSTRANFDGEFTISGTLSINTTHHANIVTAILVPDDTSLAKLPLSAGIQQPVQIQLNNPDIAQKESGIKAGENKKVTILVNNYTTVSSPDNLPSTADFVSIQ